MKLSFTLNWVLKCANDFKLTRFAFNLVQKIEAVPHTWKSFLNPSDTQQRWNKYLTKPVFSVHTVSYGSSFCPPWAINRRWKNLVRNLQYRPQTRLVRGIYFWVKLYCTNCASTCLYFQVTLLCTYNLKIIRGLQVKKYKYMCIRSSKTFKFQCSFVPKALTPTGCWWPVKRDCHEIAVKCNNQKHKHYMQVLKHCLHTWSYSNLKVYYHSIQTNIISVNPNALTKLAETGRESI